MSDTSRVLCVGAGLEPTARELERRAEDVVATALDDPDGGIDTLSRTQVDCIVSELTTGTDTDGLEFLRAVRDREPTVPFLLVLGPDETERTSDAVAAGVTDFHVRRDGGEDELLASRIELALARGETGDRAETGTGVEGAEFADDRDDLLDADRLRQLVDLIPDPLYVLDDEGRCLVANDALLEYTGYEREHVEGRPIETFIDEDSYETGLETVASLYRDGGGRDAFEVTIRGADETTRTAEVSVSVVTDDEGAYAGSVGAIRDITDRKERIRELARYEAIIETAPIGLLVVDENGHIQWHNEEFTDDLGLGDRDLVGTDFSALAMAGYFPEATLENYLERVRRLLSDETDDEQVSYEERWVDDDGEEGITEVNMGLLPLEDGEFTGTVYAFRNVTERAQYQRELERQNDRLEKFASLVSHDLRNPLNVAQGHLDLLETECENDSIEETRWAIDRMEELIDDLLALARYGRTVADREQVELADLAEVAWAGVDTADATLVIDLEGTISAHEGRVRELLENLFRNAVEHGGEDVTVTVGQLPSDDADGFFVEDDGSGLPDTDEIFEFGHTTADDGTGFGLGIVSEIADAHGWEVTARNGHDGGARFEIRNVRLLEDGPIAE